MLVIIESPYAGELERNKKYLQRCILDAIYRGESPYASHQMLTEALDDSVPQEREAGIKAGFQWRRVADATVVYEDYGISSGMRYGILDAKALGKPIIYRRIGENPD